MYPGKLGQEIAGGHLDGELWTWIRKCFGKIFVSSEDV
jgi:hypothetical protein